MEQGSHSELIARPEGAYSTLVGLQMRALQRHEGDGQQAAGPEEEAEELVPVPAQDSVGTSPFPAICLYPAASCPQVATKRIGVAW